MKLKERIVALLQNGGYLTARDAHDAFNVPMGSVTGRLCELAKEGVLERTGKQYRFKVPTPTRTKTSYFILLDQSTSMSGDNLNKEDRRPKAAALANDMVAEILKHKQEDDFTLGFFAGNVDWTGRRHGSNALTVDGAYLTRATGTNLCRALIEAIQLAKQVKNPKAILCFTDGEHNGYTTWGLLKEVLSNVPDDLTVAILVPEGSEGHRLLKQSGIPEGNIRTYRTMEEARSETVSSTASYVEARKRGARSVKNYFRADLSRVTLTDFERDLTEVTGQIRGWLTAKETTIEALISERTKSPYEPGTGFFEVMKREGRIKGDRLFLILEPTTGRCFANGKRTVRSVCGYPEGDVAIKPGNHAGFVLLCQSKSSEKDTFRARILPRGTHVVHWPAGR